VTSEACNSVIFRRSPECSREFSLRAWIPWHNGRNWIVRFRELWSGQAEGGNGPQSPDDSALATSRESDEKLKTDILDAYLERFEEFESGQRLNEAFVLARQLEGAWRLFKWQQAIACEEYESVGYQKIARLLQRISKEMIMKNDD